MLARSDTIEEKEHGNCLLFLLTITIVKIRSRPFASAMFIAIDLLVGWSGILRQCSIRSIQ
jgi:hypothetical protein